MNTCRQTKSVAVFAVAVLLITSLGCARRSQADAEAERTRISQVGQVAPLDVSPREHGRHTATPELGPLIDRFVSAEKPFSSTTPPADSAAQTRSAATEGRGTPVEGSDPAARGQQHSGAGGGPGTPAKMPTEQSRPGPTGSPAVQLAPTYSVPDDAGMATIASVLSARYDAILTALATDPVSALDPSHPARLALDELVGSGSPLGVSILELITGWAASGLRVIPDSNGITYRTSVTGTNATMGSRFEFVWCSYWAGPMLDSATGVVVNDDVNEVQGTGRAVRRSQGSGPPWMLDLWGETLIDELPPGSPDPCT